MAGSGSDWRTSDVVAYDVMRDLARSVIGVLVRRASDGDDTVAGKEARAIYDRVVLVNGYDRAAVDAVTVELLARWSDLIDDRHG